MKKIALGIILIWLLPLLIPIAILAAPSDSVRITATGANVTAITDFVVVLTDQGDTWFEATGTWNDPVGIDYTMVRRSFTDYPSSPTDGELVYQGLGETFTETITDTSIERVYYRAWAYDSGEYSPPVQYLLEVTSGMVSAMLLGVFIFFALVPTVASAVSKVGRGVLATIAAGAWIFLGVYNYTIYSAVWDIYYSLFFFCMFMAVVCILIPTVFLRDRDFKTEDTEDWGEDEPLRQAILQEEEDQERMDRMMGKSKVKQKKASVKLKRFEKYGEL